MCSQRLVSPRLRVKPSVHQCNCSHDLNYQQSVYLNIITALFFNKRLRKYIMPLKFCESISFGFNRNSVYYDLTLISEP